VPDIPEPHDFAGSIGKVGLELARELPPRKITRDGAAAQIAASYRDLVDLFEKAK
jgi:hypothetical protein